MGSRDGFAEGGVTPLEGGGVGRSASPSAASTSYMWVGGGGGAGNDKEEQTRGRTNLHDPGRPWWGGGGQVRGFGGEASVSGGGAQALAWREVSGSSQGAWRGMERSRSESTHLDRLRSRSVDSDKPVDEAGLQEDAAHGVRQAEEGGVRMMRRIQSDAHLRAPALESQQEKDSKLTRAVYWWMSTSQDPENIRKALFDLELEDKEENDLTDVQLLAVMQRRLEIVEESSTSSDSSTLSESDDETPRQKERRLQKVESPAASPLFPTRSVTLLRSPLCPWWFALLNLVVARLMFVQEAEAARRKKRKKAYKKKEKQRKEEKKERESRKK